jgi:hypothetical protein
MYRHYSHGLSENRAVAHGCMPLLAMTAITSFDDLVFPCVLCFSYVCVNLCEGCLKRS